MIVHTKNERESENCDCRKRLRETNRRRFTVHLRIQDNVMIFEFNMVRGIGLILLYSNSSGDRRSDQ